LTMALLNGKSNLDHVFWKNVGNVASIQPTFLRL
jgi:hypothetical protein